MPSGVATTSSLLRGRLLVGATRWLGIANACEEDIGKLWETLGRPAVVALGRAAAEQCRQAELPHGVVPHPQYVRRFHHHHGRRYGAMIREAAQYQEDLSGALRHPSA